MTVFKSISKNSSNKTESFYKKGFIACFGFCVGTVVYGFITDLALTVIFERMFFQCFSVLFFASH